MTTIDEESNVGSYDESTSIISESISRVKKNLVLRGQMLHMEEWGAILFLGTPV